MRRVVLAVVVACSAGACRSYDSYSPITDQAGLIPAEQFARYGRQQAEIVAIGRALSEWRMTGDQTGQTDRAAKLFARAIDCDVLGQSYYPWWHGSLLDLRV